MALFLSVFLERSRYWLRKNPKWQDPKFLYRWTGWWLGRVGRAGLAVLPLGLVLALCVTTLAGWRGKSRAEELTPAMQLNRDWHNRPPGNEGSPKAAFERYHVLHANVQVPQF